MLNNFTCRYQGGGSWFKDGTKTALAAFDNELST
jgi:hypothetical protein